MAITPLPGLISQVSVGGTAENVFPTNIQGGFISNPFTSNEVLYVDPINDAGLEAIDTTFALQPGQTWQVPAGQSTKTSVNSPDSNHTFSSIYWV